MMRKFAPNSQRFARSQDQGNGLSIQQIPEKLRKFARNRKYMSF